MVSHSVPQTSGQTDLFLRRLVDIIDMTHELVLLASLIDWAKFDSQYDSSYHPSQGAPGLPTRLMVALHLLKYMFNLSDEELIARWV
ncbi:MAG: transposase [Planctomycetaceae bacterium]|jgi:IS5 family transposase|nr:transposase [Planctomycetaceae bacterium]